MPVKLELLIDDSQAVTLQHLAAALGMTPVDLFNEKLILADAIIAAVAEGGDTACINSDFIQRVTQASKTLAIGQLIAAIKARAFLGSPLDTALLAEDDDGCG
jgi:hypothetical protein